MLTLISAFSTCFVFELSLYGSDILQTNRRTDGRTGNTHNAAYLDGCGIIRIDVKTKNYTTYKRRT